MKQFSIIIPVCNAEKYLRKCLDSVMNQTFSDYEVIFVDDGSEDSSVSILEEYQKKSERVTVIKQAHSNAGVARNRGIDAAEGKYLLFLDADDFLETDAFEKISKAAERNMDPDLIVYGVNEFHSENEDIGNLFRYEDLPEEEVFSPESVSDHLFTAFQNWPWNKAFRRGFVKKEGIRFQDVERSNDIRFVSLSLLLSEKICLIRSPLVNHRIGHDESMQANNSAEPLAFWKALKQTYEDLKVHSDRFVSSERSYLNEALSVIVYYLESVKNDESAYHLLKAFICYQGERDFHFLEHDEDYYFKKEDYQRYRDLLSHSEDTLFKEKYEKTKNSLSYRIGNAVLWLPGKISGVVTSLKNNGLSYTIKRTLFHLGMVKDNDPVRTNEKREED